MIVTTSPLLLLQHRREGKRKLQSSGILKLVLSPDCFEVVVGRSLKVASQSTTWAHAVLAGRRPLLLYPRADALSADDVRGRLACGERFLLVAIDGTWSEADEMLHASKTGMPDSEYDCLALPSDSTGLFSGCRKPPGPGHLSTLEAVAMAMRVLEGDAPGAEVARSLLRPMLRMVAHQAQLTGERMVHRPYRPGYMPGLERAAALAVQEELGHELG
jgi:DTW domain-containing protein YfiP